MSTPHPYDIEWYRPGLLVPVVVVWSIGASLMTVGVLACAFALDNTGRFPLLWQRIAGVIGGLGTIGGALTGLLGILRILSRPTACLTLRRDGVRLEDEDGEVVVAWEALTGCHSEGQAVILEREGAPPVVIRHRFMGISAEQLVERVTTLQRQALLGVLDMKQRHSLPVGRVRSGS